jgi:streptomycin 6-kinase
LIPSGFLEGRGRDDSWFEWVRALPRLVDAIMDEWELEIDGEAMYGFTALVVPVRDAAGRSCAARFAWPHDEQEHEHLGLQAWHGDGTVLMYRADPARAVMLLERLHQRDLNSIDVIEACDITAGFYRRLHIPALPQLRTLSSYIDRWTNDLDALPVNGPIPRRMVEQARTLGRDFVTDSATDAVIIHGDLHYENVLAADREPWLVIDPKPMAGDGHYEVAPLLWNRFDEIVASGDLRKAIRQRFHTSGPPIRINRNEGKNVNQVTRIAASAPAAKRSSAPNTPST